jgi:hypothetical protein
LPAGSEERVDAAEIGAGSVGEGFVGGCGGGKEGSEFHVDDDLRLGAGGRMETPRRVICKGGI